MQSSLGTYPVIKEKRKAKIDNVEAVTRTVCLLNSINFSNVVSSAIGSADKPLK